MWECGECGCLRIAGSVPVCPQCGANRPEPATPSTEESPAVPEKTSAKASAKTPSGTTESAAGGGTDG